MVKKKDLLYKIEHLENYIKNVDFEQEKMSERVEKNENAIKAMIDLCQPIIIERLSGLVGEIANGLESELKNIAVKRTKKSKTESKPTTKTTKKGVKKNV